MNPSNTCTCGHDQEFHQWGSHNEKCDCRAFTPTADSTDDLEQQLIDIFFKAAGGISDMARDEVAQVIALIAAHDRRRDEDHLPNCSAVKQAERANKDNAVKGKSSDYQPDHFMVLCDCGVRLRAEFADTPTEDTK